MTSLKAQRLKGTRVTAEVARGLAAKLPGCRVDWDRKGAATKG